MKMLRINNIKIIFSILLLFLIVSANLGLAQEVDTTIIPTIDSSKVILLNTDYPDGSISLTDVPHETAGEILENPFKVQVLYQGKEPLEGWPVYFTVISTPPKADGTKLTEIVVSSDKNGFAESYAVLGSISGNYEFAARIRNGSNQDDIVYFKAYARKVNWVFYLVSGLIGGLGLFLFGMGLMSDGLKKTAGGRMRTLLSTLTNNKIVAVAVGTFVTMIIQSSSATTVMLVSFVQAQLMTFAQSLGIILGADIGTTITAQLIAFKLTDYALIVIGIGFAMMFLFKSKKLKNIGEAILGFGLLFFGMWIMSDAMAPLRNYEPFINILLQLENPLVGILVGTLFTALIQSSSAFTGIIIVLGSQGLITLDAAIPLLFGANIGTSITAALASINTGREAKRVALAHTLFKVLGVLLFVWWIPSYAEIIRAISPDAAKGLTGTALLADVVPRQIANAHTIFNVALTLIVLPFTTQAAAFIYKLLPDKTEPEEEGEFKTKYLEDSLVSTPTLALNLAKAETINMATKVQKMVVNILPPFFKDDENLLDEIRDIETEVNFLNVHINKYLMKISQESLAEERADEIFQIMHSVTELEQIGDIIAKRLIPLAEKKMLLNTQFSKDGQDEIKDYHLRTMKQISRAIEVFKDVNLKDAKKMEKKYKKYRMMEMDLRRTHFERLRSDIPETVATSEIHLELIELLKRISSNATNIARFHLELRSEQEEEATLKVKLAKIEKKKKKKRTEENEEDEIIDEEDVNNRN
jgi:phosphate:Na+ symporter